MKHFFGRLWTRTGLTILLILAGLSLLPVSLAQAAAPTLVVNANQVLRSVTHVASGGLYGLGTNSTPDDSMVLPLHPRDFVQMAPNGHQLPNGEPTPGGDALVVAPKAARAGAMVTIRMPDYYPNFPYKWVSWSNWLSVVDGQIAARQADPGVTNINAWELWNEPDWTWDTTNAGSFNAGWVRTYQEVRSKDTTTRIQGPSISWYNGSYMSSFLSYAKANNAVPNIISWHELGGQGSIAADISAYRALESSLGIGPLPIAIEEYAKTSEVGVPGSLVGYIAKFERGGIDNAELAFWNQYGTFDDLVVNNNQPNGGWWMYKWYGDMTGNMLVTTPPAQTGLDGAASVNSANNLVSVIVGGGSGSNAVTINGLNALSAFGSSATVTLEYVPSLGRTAAVTSTNVLSVTNYPITNGSITVPINNMDSAGGYRVQVTPTGTGGGGGTNGVLRGAGSNRCLDVPAAATANGTLLDIWDCNGGSNQQWTSLSNGALQVYGNKCLDVPGHATAAGTRVEIWDCNGGANQQWTLNSNGTVVGRESGLCLDVTGAGTANGTAVEIWNCTGGSNQKWTRS